MRTATASNERNDFYCFNRYGDVAVLNFGKNFLTDAIDLALENPLLDIFSHIGENATIKALVIVNCLEQIGCRQYIDFCRQVSESEADCKSFQKMCNFIDRLIMKIVELNKPIIYADGGEIISLFLSMSLACDYRITATHTVFQKSYFELETIPKGGSAYFLCKMLGYSRAKKFLMSQKDVNALEALEWGIVDQIVPHDELEKTAIQTARNLSKSSIRTLAGIKRQLNYSLQDLKDYLDFESLEYLKTIGSSFSKSKEGGDGSAAKGTLLLQNGHHIALHGGK